MELDKQYELFCIELQIKDPQWLTKIIGHHGILDGLSYIRMVFEKIRAGMKPLF